MFFVVRGIVCEDLGFDLYFALNVRVVGSDQAIPTIYDCNSKGYYDTVYIMARMLDPRSAILVILDH